MLTQIDQSHPLLTAVAVHSALTRELDWLRIAARSYRSDVYRRLVGHSANRLFYTLKVELKIGCVGVQFRIQDVKNQVASPIEVNIMWTGRRSEEVLHAWSQIMKSDAQC